MFSIIGVVFLGQLSVVTFFPGVVPPRNSQTKHNENCNDCQRQQNRQNDRLWQKIRCLIRSRIRTTCPTWRCSTGIRICWWGWGWWGWRRWSELPGGWAACRRSGRNGCGGVWRWGGGCSNINVSTCCKGVTDFTRKNHFTIFPRSTFFFVLPFFLPIPIPLNRIYSIRLHIW